MHKGVENDGIAGKACNDVRDPGPPHQTNLILFPKSNPPPRSLDADGEPHLPSAFIPLSDATQAVVLRLAKGFPKVKVMRADTWEGEDTSPL
ncbi:hypothetical protein O9X81_05335 [Agrobacterium salinitolerans]|uniref:hypothetical protein n=1 Tax=Agrobacterium salinitolerans TaxID=1183413 RepID=UPI0022B84A52|nr:hypothetical protein [Agrobacterium salinitolerans]MCZ7856029.1 hypothetical protein [Agrobacterium salinitolerans]